MGTCSGAILPGFGLKYVFIYMCIYRLSCCSEVVDNGPKVPRSILQKAFANTPPVVVPKEVVYFPHHILIFIFSRSGRSSSSRRCSCLRARSRGHRVFSLHLWQIPGSPKAFQNQPETVQTAHECGYQKVTSGTNVNTNRHKLTQSDVYGRDAENLVRHKLTQKTYIKPSKHTKFIVKNTI